MTDIVERLKIKADMIAMGERIKWGSDSEIMHEAADTIEALRAENAKLREALKTFARQRLSSETHTTTLEYLSPLGELQKQIAQIEKRDAEIRTARAAMEGKDD